MRRKSLFSLISVILVLTCVVVSSAQSRREIEVFDLVNQERAKARLSILVWDDRLGSIARDYSRQMARENFFDHYDKDGKNVMDRANEARLKNWLRIGENLFACSPSPDFARRAVVGWMNSRTHRENILDANWTSGGIGIATASDGSLYITQVFTEDEKARSLNGR